MNNRIYQGHFARKRFGQNFLTNQFIIDAIVAAINPQSDEAIIEIGPGLGALTEPVVERIKHMIVIELDRNLASRLEKHPLLKNKLTIYQQDVLKVNFSDIAEYAGKPLRIFGNLPYNISTPLIFYLFNYPHAIYDMHFMLQKEVVNRLVAQPNSKDYGRLSIMAQYYCEIMPALEVPRTSFTPRPNVDSALVRLLPHSVILDPVRDVRMLTLVTTQVFSHRRKIIRNSIGDLFTPAQLLELDIDTSLRAENISVEQYCKLANALAANCTSD